MEKRILSVQSHVVHGYCGNRAATFPLQLLGWEVDCLNTVQFSNHTGVLRKQTGEGYPSFKGFKTNEQQILEIFKGLEENGLVDYSHLLTGYAPGSESVRALHEIVSRLKQRNPGLIYVLDPVMGDNGSLYVSKEVPDLYKSLLRTATLITPNQFEAAVLTGIKITDRKSLIECLLLFHKEPFNVPHVVITSLELLTGNETSSSLLYTAGSSAKGDKFLISYPKIEGIFVGTGDAFSALMAAHFMPNKESLSECTRKALTSIAGILWRTSKAQSGEDEDGYQSKDKAYNMRKAELRIVQSQEDILYPTNEKSKIYHISPCDKL